MALKTVSGGWRGFSSAKEASFGTAQTVDTSLNFSGDFMDARPEKVWDDKDEFTGELAPTRVQVLTQLTEGKHTQNLMPHNAALFWAWLLGKVVTVNPNDANQATVRKHTVTMDKDVVDLVTRTLREYDGAHYMEYPGCICTELSLSAAVEEHAKLEAVLRGMGKETEVSPTPSRPAQVLEDYLCFGDINIKTGGSFDGSAVTGGTSISARVQNFKLGVKNGGKLRFHFGDPTKFAGSAIRGRMLDFDLAMKMDFKDRSEKQALLAGTTFIVEIPMIGALIGSSLTNHFAVNVILPKVAYNKVVRGQDDGLLNLDLGFRVLADPTYGPIVVQITNEQTAYL